MNGISCERFKKSGNFLNKFKCNRNKFFKPKILLVEDTLIIQKVHELMLKKLDCDVDTASDGNEALKKFQNGYDLIFMDIGLPDIDGITVTKEMRLDKNKKTPIVGLTAFDVEDILDECLKVGIDDILIKPTSLEKFQEILKRYT